MRLLDLMRPYLDGAERVVDRTPPTLGLARRILLGGGIEYHQAMATQGEDAPAGVRTLSLASLGPDPGIHGDPATVWATIGGLTPGGRAVVVLGWDAATLPYQRILDPLIANHCQVLQVASIDEELIPSAAVIERVERLEAPRDELAEPVVPAPTDDAGRLALALRLANEHAFLGFVARASRPTAAGPDGSPPDERSAWERARLQKMLDERAARIERLEAEVSHLEASNSMRVGRLMVGAARSPVSAARLPLGLYRIWRGRPR